MKKAHAAACSRTQVLACRMTAVIETVKKPQISVIPMIQSLHLQGQDFQKLPFSTAWLGGEPLGGAHPGASPTGVCLFLITVDKVYCVAYSVEARKSATCPCGVS